MAEGKQPARANDAGCWRVPPAALAMAAARTRRRHGACCDDGEGRGDGRARLAIDLGHLASDDGAYRAGEFVGQAVVMALACVFWFPLMKEPRFSPGRPKYWHQAAEGTASGAPIAAGPAASSCESTKEQTPAAAAISAALRFHESRNTGRAVRSEPVSRGEKPCSRVYRRVC